MGAALAQAIRDPLYRDLIAAYGSSSLELGGFVAHPQLPVGCHELPVTPIAKLRERYRAGRRNAVLLLCGALAPVHEGHLALLEAGREELERHGVNVCAGYLSPSHDEYVLTKAPGTERYPAGRRLELCRAACAESEWLETCPWEAQHVPVAVNFSEVIAHFEVAVREVDPSIEVWFLFGADNAGFARAFVRRGRCICGTRTGGGEELITGDPLLAGREDILITRLPEAESALSSTGLRARRPAGASAVEHRRRAGSWYGVRDDRRAIAAGAAVELTRLRTFSGQLLEALAWAGAPGKPQLIAPEGLEERYRRLRGRGGRLLVMDHLIGDPGAERLEASRAFRWDGAHVRPACLVARPGAPALEEQLRSIAPGRVLVVDDDRASGSTEAEVRRLLATRGVEVERWETLITGDPSDVVDLRDFILGAPQGGLVVQAPGLGAVRVPYLEPYVNLATRASLDPERVRGFFLAIWRANLELHRSSGLRVADACPSSRSLYRWLGFAGETPLAEVADWHLQRLG